MDMSRYSSSLFLKVDDVRDKPRRAVITQVEPDGKFDKPNLRFSDGTLLSCNGTNCANLIKAYGDESDDWLNQEIELFVGQVQFNGKTQESVLVKPISPPRQKKARKRKPDDFAAADDMDDEIPFG